MKIAELTPNVSVGGILFGDSIENYDDRQFEYEGEILSSAYQSYSFADIPVTAYVEDGRIESITCETECVWQGKNLINLEYDEFVVIYPQKPDKIDRLTVMQEDGSDGQEQDVYYYGEIGLMLWVFDNKIVTVIATVYEEE